MIADCLTDKEAVRDKPLLVKGGFIVLIVEHTGVQMEKNIIISIVCSNAIVGNLSKLEILHSLNELFRKRERQYIIKHPIGSGKVSFIHRVLIIDKSYQVIKHFEV